MTAWKLYYENRFPFGQRGTTTAGKPFRTPLFNVFRSAAGSQTESRPFHFRGQFGASGIPLRSGHGLTYRFENRADDIVGIDLAVTLWRSLRFAPEEDVGLSRAVCECEPDLSLNVTPLGRFDDGGQRLQRLRLDFAFDSFATSIEAESSSSVFAVRCRWTTNGQFHAWVNDELVAYRQGVNTGSRYSCRQLKVGETSPRDDLAGRRVILTAVRLVELREDNAMRSLVEQLDVKGPDDVPDRCEALARKQIDESMDQARSLMTAFVESQTRSWRAGDGGEPFTPAAVAVHKAGGSFGEVFGRYLRSGSAAERQDLIGHLTVLLGHLAADQPELFRQFVNGAGASRHSRDHLCDKAQKSVRDANPELVKKLGPLSNEVGELIESLAKDL